MPQSQPRTKRGARTASASMRLRRALVAGLSAKRSAAALGVGVWKGHGTSQEPVGRLVLARSEAFPSACHAGSLVGISGGLSAD